MEDDPESGGKGYPVPREERRPEGRGGTSRPSSYPVVRETSFELRHGPIPDAAELARYSYAHPEAPAIILAEFKDQASHRRAMEVRAANLERRSLNASITSERLGVACGLLIALVGFGCATYLVATGHEIAGTVMFGLDVGALVSAFILGRPRAELKG